MGCVVNQRTIGAFALVGCMLAAGAAAAQDTPVPNRLTEAYGSWTVECTNVKVPAKTDDGSEGEPESRLICEAGQTFTNQKTGNEVAKLVFAVDADDSEKLIVAARIIVDASFEKTPSLVDGEEEIATGKFTRCSGSFCFMQFDVDNDKVDQLTAAESPGLQYPIANGRVIRINIAADGLVDALAALKSKG